MACRIPAGQSQNEDAVSHHAGLECQIEVNSNRLLAVVSQCSLYPFYEGYSTLCNYNVPCELW